jgi:hypothetical protein
MLRGLDVGSPGRECVICRRSADGRPYNAAVAISSQDVAFVGVIAAVVAAVTGPLTAWLVASSNRSHEERLRYDMASEDDYLRLLRAVNARSDRL